MTIELPEHPAVRLPYGFFATPNPDDSSQITMWEVCYLGGKSFVPWPRGTRYHRPGLSSGEYNTWITQVVDSIAANLTQSQRLFAAQTVRCWSCGRKLTNKRSRAEGIGPECRTRIA